MRRGVLRCLLAAVLFGATAPAAAELAGGMSAFTLAGLLYLGAGVAVLPGVLAEPPRRSAVASEWKAVAVAVVAGGAAGPVLLMAGLARTSSATASLLLNTELVATVVLAAVLFREHLGPRIWTSTGLVALAGALLTWEPGAALDTGALLVVGACACWGLDNGVTASVQQLSPRQVVLAKGVVAGGANLVIGVVGQGSRPSPAEVVAALAIGGAGYGWSIVSWVAGARDLGAARAQVIFATAPFIGAGIAWAVMHEAVTVVQVVALALASVGVGVSLRSGHDHHHRHDETEHDHEHVHGAEGADGHHDHVHDDGFVGRHSHRHLHRPMAHAHPHVPDLHHRHGH